MSPDTLEEYYLKTSGGQDLGIVDMETGLWTWYINGADRVAKVTPRSYQQPDSITITMGADSDNSKKKK